MIPAFSKTITLRDGRTVEFRYLLPDDAEKLMTYINAIVAEGARILLNVQMTLEEEEVYVKNALKEAEDGNAVKILVIANGKIVGGADMRRQPWKHKHIGLFGISLSKEYRAVGLGKLLSQEILAHAKEKLGLEMAILTVDAQNPPARALYTSIGFKEYGVLPHAIFHKGNYEDQVYMYKML